LTRREGERREGNGLTFAEERRVVRSDARKLETPIERALPDVLRSAEGR
jgi:hypothetical protein